MGEEYKTQKRIVVMLETPNPEVAAYFGGYIDGIHDTCAWMVKVTEYGKQVDTFYRWVIDLKERLNISGGSVEEIRTDFERQIKAGLENILHNKVGFDYSIRVKELSF